MKKPLQTLVLGTLAFWALLVYPASLLQGDVAYVFSAVAAAVCLVPTALTLILGRRAMGGTVEQQMMLVLGGSALRMAPVVIIGVALFMGIPYFHTKTFWLWILAFYFFTLALEVLLLLKSKPATGNSPDHS